MKLLSLWRPAMLALVIAGGLAVSGLGNADAAPISDRKVTSASCSLTAAPGELTTMVPPIVEIGWQNQFVSSVVITLFDANNAEVGKLTESINMRSGFKKYSLGVAGQDPLSVGAAKAEIQLIDNRTRVRTVVTRACA